MARIRTIKPEFFTSETVAALPLLGRLAFIGLWTHCDDDGRCLANPRLMKAALFALDDNVTAEVVAECVDALAESDLVDLYESSEDGRVWLQVCSWAEHQVINRPSKVRSPARRENDPSVRIHGSLTEESVRAHPRKGKERKGKEQGAAREFRPEREEVATVFDHWRVVMGKTNATKLDDKRRGRIEWALKHYELDDVLAAISGCAATPFNMGDNRDRKRYDDLELIMRDAKHLEDFRDADPARKRTRSNVVPMIPPGQWCDGGDPSRIPTEADIASGDYARYASW